MQYVGTNSNFATSNNMLGFGDVVIDQTPKHNDLCSGSVPNIHSILSRIP